MLAELSVEDHRQQTWPRPGSRDRMERRRRLGDPLAGPAGELLTYRLDHFPLPRHYLKRLGDVLAELGELAAASGTGARRRDNDPFARQMRRQRRAPRPPPDKTVHCRRRAKRCRSGDLSLGGSGLQLLELQLQLVEQVAAAFRRLSELLALHPGNQQLQMCHHRFGTRGARFGLLPRDALGNQRRLQRIDVVGDRLGHRKRLSHPIQPLTRPGSGASQTVAGLTRPLAAASSAPGCASQSLQACRPTERT